MKLLILGGNGMAGHMLVDYFRSKPAYSVFYTTRDPKNPGGLYLDLSDIRRTELVLAIVRPDVVINAVGILNSQAETKWKAALEINGIFPHMLRKWMDQLGGKLVHISTDCVFAGTKGDYREDDSPDGTSAYAKTKAMGEVRDEAHLTIRTSIIGPERKDGIGLLHWFMKQQGTVKGYRHVLWNGVTTLQLAKSIDHMIVGKVNGLYHLTAPETVSKLELLQMIQSVYGKSDVTVVPDGEVVLNRTLRNTRTDYVEEVPPYRTMLEELRDWTAKS